MIATTSLHRHDLSDRHTSTATHALLARTGMKEGYQLEADT
jgi:hypothetical protein